MKTTPPKKTPACPDCQSTNTVKNGGGRRVCRDCTRSFREQGRNGIRSGGLYGKCSKCGHEGRMEKNGFKRGQQMVQCVECGSRQYHLATIPIADFEAGESVRYVITSAQNATRVHRGFMASLQVYCKHHNAKLIVIPNRYKNPTFRGERESDEWWAAELTPYLMDKRIKLANNLQVMGDIKIQPTATTPLSGLDTMTGTACGIVGHPKIALETIPTRGHELPKMLWTTGACTVANYSESKAGAKGKFHHVIGALVVELDHAKRFHVRNINAEGSGAFIDLNERFAPDGVSSAGPAAALVLGDIHAERVDKRVANVTLGTGGIIDTLRPKKIVLHDVLDFGSASHHNGFFERFLRRALGQDDVHRELTLTCAWIDACHRDFAETVVVSSNHHNHLRKWLEKSDFRLDTQNAHVYASVLAETLDEIKKTQTIPDPFHLVAKRILEKPARFLKPNESFTVCGIELGYHGDIGPNGSRGSAKALDKIGTKTVIGHSHSPRIVGGCYQVGTTSQLDMTYNIGPSSWLHSHVVVYANGKRTHIHVIDGMWRRQERRAKPRLSSKRSTHD